MEIWLYHVNPKGSQWRYPWDLTRPITLANGGEWEFGAGQMYRQIRRGDHICVYMKNIPPNPDGVYVVGAITRVKSNERTFIWLPDAEGSANLISNPITPGEVREFFDRSYGGSMQRLENPKVHAWLELLEQRAPAAL